MGDIATIATRSTATSTTLPFDEASLIRRAQSGDQDAFAELVENYDQNVLRIAYNLLRSEEEAKDIYQEAFLRIFKNLSNFRFDCSFHTWLYRIVTNVCLDHLRKRKVRKEEPSVRETPAGTIDLLDQFAEKRAGLNPERNLINQQLQDKIKSTLEELTPRERIVFELRHYQGLRLRKIGEMLGTSEEAAKNCLFRATQKMRSALGEFL